MVGVVYFFVFMIRRLRVANEESLDSIIVPDMINGVEIIDENRNLLGIMRLLLIIL